MIIIQNYWSKFGWYIILFGSLISLIILWCFKKSIGSCTTNIQEIMKTLFSRKIIDKEKKETTSKGEKQCKDFLEYLFKKKFEKIRPHFLINPITNQPLELDCYNEELKLAVEYNGIQHYKFNKMMHQNSRHSFQNQQYRDHIKKELCEKNGIKLVIVPYQIKEENISGFLYEELKKLGYINSTLIQT